MWTGSGAVESKTKICGKWPKDGKGQILLILQLAFWKKEISWILSQSGRPSVTIVIKMIVFGKGLKGNGGRNIEVWSSANKFEYLPVEDGQSLDSFRFFEYTHVLFTYILISLNKYGCTDVFQYKFEYLPEELQRVASFRYKSALVDLWTERSGKNVVGTLRHIQSLLRELCALLPC